MRPRGRRPAGSDTRAEIVAAARTEFAEAGYAAASIRSIARRAEVDPALVHHYFDGKPALFGEVLDFPVNPEVLLRRLHETPREKLGSALVATFLDVWDDGIGRERFAGDLRLDPLLRGGRPPGA
jgi:AcrR family transcriptional regulator